MEFFSSTPTLFRLLLVYRNLTCFWRCRGRFVLSDLESLWAPAMSSRLSHYRLKFSLDLGYYRGSQTNYLKGNVINRGT